jgi:hypothetical protein
MLAVAIQWITLRRQAHQRHESAEEYRYRLDVDCEPGEDAIRTFVEAHLGQEIKSLWVHYIADADLNSLSQLKRLRSLTYLTLSKASHADPIGTGGNDLFVFAPILTDVEVRELSQIKTPRHITIWYGSFSDAQKYILRCGNPHCALNENLNKL